MTLSSLRRSLYTGARLLGDLHAVESGRVPQRIVRRAVYRHGSRFAAWVCRLFGL